MKLLGDPSWNHRVAVVPGVMADECRDVIQDFFQEKRKRTKEE
jgi:tRNA(adenine34) deaminase